MLTQIRQIDAMLARVIAKSVEEDFIRYGGIREAMSRARRNARGY